MFEVRIFPEDGSMGVVYIGCADGVLAVREALERCGHMVEIDTTTFEAYRPGHPVRLHGQSLLAGALAPAN